MLQNLGSLVIGFIPPHLIPLALLLAVVIVFAVAAIARKSRIASGMADALTKGDTPEEVARELKHAREKASDALPGAMKSVRRANKTEEELRRGAEGK